MMRSGLAVISSARRKLAQFVTANREGAWSLLAIAEGHLTAGRRDGPFNIETLTINVNEQQLVSVEIQHVDSCDLAEFAYGELIGTIRLQGHPHGATNFRLYFIYPAPPFTWRLYPPGVDDLADNALYYWLDAERFRTLLREVLQPR